MSYIFTKKIICLNCEKRFRGLNERGKKKYICGGYHNYKNCIRWIIEEEQLVDVIRQHYMIEQNQQERLTGKSKSEIETSYVSTEDLVRSIHKIGVDPVKQELKVEYIDGTVSVITPDRHTYWSDQNSQ